MTPDLQREHAYRMQERLGNLCGSGQPTLEQESLARKEADEAIEELREKQLEQQEMGI